MREVRHGLYKALQYHIHLHSVQLLDDEELDKVHSRGLNLAEGQSRSYHCKTPDCKGWCIYEDDVCEIHDVCYRTSMLCCDR